MIGPGLQGRVILVTGANHGIGAATARTLAAQSARMFVAYLRLPLDEDGGLAVEAGSTAVRGRLSYRPWQATTAEEVTDVIWSPGGLGDAWEGGSGRSAADPSEGRALGDHRQRGLVGACADRLELLRT